MITGKADEVRKVFGPGVQLLFASEGGMEVGKRPEETRAGTTYAGKDTHIGIVKQRTNK